MTANLARQRRGRVNYLNGLTAEDAVAQRYQRDGACVAERRWRGASGEVDLILRQGDELVFVEVKRAKTFARAAERITRAQFNRICAAAREYAGRQPLGLLTPVRIDVALVDATGDTDILQNVSFL